MDSQILDCFGWFRVVVQALVVIAETGRASKKAAGGFSLEYDVARKMAQGLGAYLEKLDHLVEEGVGRDSRYWALANALSALYPAGTDEKRWVEGVLARKKRLRF